MAKGAGAACATEKGAGVGGVNTMIGAAAVLAGAAVVVTAGPALKLSAGAMEEPALLQGVDACRAGWRDGLGEVWLCVERPGTDEELTVGARLATGVAKSGASAGAGTGVEAGAQVCALVESALPMERRLKDVLIAEGGGVPVVSRIFKKDASAGSDEEAAF